MADAVLDTEPALERSTADQYAKCLKDMQDKAEKGDRSAFMDAFKELKFYGYTNDYSPKLYDQLPELKNDQGSFRAHINRVAEYEDLFGSYLFSQNPEASVVPMENADQWDQKRFDLEAKILDYCMRHGGMETHARRALSDGLLSGRGVLWFGFNARKGIPQVVFDSVENFAVDQDARSIEEINWISRKRRKPRFEFKGMYPNALIDIDEELKGVGKDGEVIEYVEYYLRVGIGNYCNAAPYSQVGADVGPVTMPGNSAPMPGKAPAAEVDNSPQKYIVAEGKLVAVDSWEIPFHLMDAWPCRPIDFRPQPEKTWPVSPMQAGLGHLRAMNWLYTFYINRVRRTSRITYARLRNKAQQLEQNALDTITGADGTDEGQVINFEIPIADTDADIRKYIQPISLEHGILEFDRMWALTNRAFEDATGLNDLIRSGQDSRQIRTASDVQFKEKRSMTRVEDMKKQVQVWLDGVMSQLAFTARYLLTPEDVGKWFGADAAAVWGRLGTPEQKQQEDMLRMQQMNMLMQRAMMQQQMAMQTAMAAPPMPGMPPPAMPPMPTQEDLEKQLGPPQIVVMDDWITEAKRQIVAGSMRVMNHDAQIDNMQFFLGSVAPIVAPTPGGIELVAAAVTEWAHLNRYTPAMQAATQKWLGTTTLAGQLMQQQAIMGAQAPAEKPTDEPSQGREKAVKGQSQ